MNFYLLNLGWIILHVILEISQIGSDTLMKRIVKSSGLASTLTLAAILFAVSCSTVNLDNEYSKKSNNAIVRIYIGLSSSKLQREINIEEVEEIISKHFNSATLQESMGFYKGEKERSLIITIINCCSWKDQTERFQEKISNLASQLKDDLGQESILVEYLYEGKSGAFEILE